MIISRVVSLIIQKNTFVKIKFMRYICELRQYFPRKRSFFRFSFFFFFGGTTAPCPPTRAPMSGSKDVHRFSIITILKGIMTF